MTCRFEPYIFRNNGSVVQLEEQGSSKALVGGSSPSRITKNRVVGQLVGRLIWDEDIVQVRVLSTLQKN